MIHNPCSPLISHPFLPMPIRPPSGRSSSNLTQPNPIPYHPISVSDSQRGMYYVPRMSRKEVRYKKKKKNMNTRKTKRANSKLGDGRAMACSAVVNHRACMGIHNQIYPLDQNNCSIKPPASSSSTPPLLPEALLSPVAYPPRPRSPGVSLAFLAGGFEAGLSWESSSSWLWWLWWRYYY
jgi:hypothetical protein